MTSRLALHFQQLPGWAGSTAARWVKVMDPPSENRWTGKLVIGRAYMPDESSNELVRQGAAGAEAWFRFLQPYVARAPYVHAWEGPNEPQPVADLAFATALGQFTKRLAELMHAAGLKVVGGCLSEGNPGGDDAHAKACYVAIAKGLQDCDYEGFHCYWVLGYSHPEAGMNDWHAFRYRRNRRYASEAGIVLPPLLITECGVDGGVVSLPKRGWKTFAPTKAIYMEQLRQFDAGLAADPYVLCATVFTSGPTGDWSDFEVDQELAGMIDQHIVSQGGPYLGAAAQPPQTFSQVLAGVAAKIGARYEDISRPNSYDRRPLSAVKAIDIHHSETSRATTWQTVRNYHTGTKGWPDIAYHVGVRLYGGVLTISLLNDLNVISYHAREGNSTDVAICFMGSYMSAKPEQAEIDAGREIIAAIRAYLGRSIPVRGHRDVPNNQTSCPGDKLEAAIPEMALNGRTLSAALRAEGDRQQVIFPNPNAALQKRIFADGFVPTSPEFKINHGGNVYVAQRADHLATGEARVYACIDGDWGNVFSS